MVCAREIQPALGRRCDLLELKAAPCNNLAETVRPKRSKLASSKATGTPREFTTITVTAALRWVTRGYAQFGWPSREAIADPTVE